MLARTATFAAQGSHEASLVDAVRPHDGVIIADECETVTDRQNIVRLRQHRQTQLSASALDRLGDVCVDDRSACSFLNLGALAQERSGDVVLVHPRRNATNGKRMSLWWYRCYEINEQGVADRRIGPERSHDAKLASVGVSVPLCLVASQPLAAFRNPPEDDGDDRQYSGSETADNERQVHKCL